MRKIAAIVVAAIICVGGMVIMVWAGILAVLITDPFSPFWAAFAPLGLAAALFTAWLMGRVPSWLYPAHPNGKLWTRIAWAVSRACRQRILGLWGGRCAHLAHALAVGVHGGAGRVNLRHRTWVGPVELAETE